MTTPKSGRSLRPHNASPIAQPVANDSGIEPNSRQRTQILHELVRVRRKAEAARLEAQASRLDASAERLESLLERIDAGEAFTPEQLREFGIGDITSPDAPTRAAQNPFTAPENLAASLATPRQLSGERIAADIDDGIDPPRIRFESWQEIREAQSRSPDAYVRHDRPHRGIHPHHSIHAPRARWRTDSEQAEQSEKRDDADGTLELPSLELTTASQSHEHEHEQMALTPAPPADPPPFVGGRNDRAAEETGEVDEAEQANAADGASELLPEEAADEPDALLSSPVVLDEQPDAPLPRRQSTAFITSVIVHLVLLLCLAGFTLTTVMPKDQIALAASADEPSEEAVETFQIEMIQPESMTSETAPDESAVPLDPLGEMKMVEVSTDALGSMSPPAPNPGAFSQNAAAASSAMKTQPNDSASKMQFCGVEGGGNHFVYLVDSSGSMGDAFISARRALLESIDMLTPEQRFYVIFFDAECDYMRITRADQNESRSVQATPANKQRLQSWAMRVEMDRGMAPYEPLEYALQTLKPDVIFLLSDGEFPQRIETLLQSENKVTNLFGESKPISIIHTISYHSREGEERMRRIAESNSGQYRHVPKP